MAGHLEQAGVRPGLVLCSSALRTRQTLELVRPALADPGTLIEDGLYAASAGQLLDRLRRLPAAIGSAMLIGHNPGLQELVLLLATASPELGVIEAKFPTCALASLDSGAVRWADLGPESAQLIGYTTPRSLD
jgi:phosphohistidine phosphatase